MIRYHTAYYRKENGADYYELFEDNNIVTVGLEIDWMNIIYNKVIQDSGGSLASKGYILTAQVTAMCTGKILRLYRSKRYIRKYVEAIPETQIAGDVLRRNPVAVAIREMFWVGK